MEDAMYGGETRRNPIYFNGMLPPYFFRAVRSFGEFSAERDEIRTASDFRTQELFPKTPANIGDFQPWNFGQRDLPKG
jgi:hypothetical protein